MNPQRRRVTTLAVLVSIVGVLAWQSASRPGLPAVTRNDVAAAENLFGLQFSDVKRDSMLDGLAEQRANYLKLREFSIPNSVPPALAFNPIPSGMKLQTVRKPIRLGPVTMPPVPRDLEELAFASVRQLGELIKARKLTSMQLTTMYVDRLKRLGPTLECTVTLTESLAVAQARAADTEIARGKYRGPLHGIPYGLKDLIATKGIRTTWGSVPYKDQMIDEDATIVKRLRAAGAVLVAKTSVGELAWGDVWFGGMTKNPWDLNQGSSGSSAGSAAATAAGLVAFAIGTETYGSIVSPSTRCGTTGLRPTYGRVSRAGAMALSWSMDKIGPICRTVEDCAIVFNAIYGPDGIDQSVVDAPFNYAPVTSLRALKIGYAKTEFDSLKEGRERDEAVLATLRSLGADLIAVSLPEYPVNDMNIILSAEAGAAFDELTRSGKDDLMVRQIKDAWPNVFRLSRFIPAVEYIQANRLRYSLIQDMDAVLRNVDVYVCPTFGGNDLLRSNLTGHPCVVLPNGFTENGRPTSITFTGRLYGEAKLLAVAKAYQDATEFHLKHPTIEEKRD